MDNSDNCNMINILNLPDEMLLAIFNKLKMVNVLYSLVNINERFNRLTLDPFYIHNLDLTMKTSCFDYISSQDDQVDRICKTILPRIHHHVNKLTVEPDSIKDILRAVDYPRLHSLSLVNFQEETLLRYLRGDTILRHFLADQITHLNVNIYYEIIPNLFRYNTSNIFSFLLSFCKHLVELTFNQYLCDTTLEFSLYNVPLTNCVSSTLTKLEIIVRNFDDCLYLLDGRLKCLSILIINALNFLTLLPNIDNTKKLPKLKYFSLTSTCLTDLYDDKIIPLLHRMLNLEELTLFLNVMRWNSTYIDGTHLYNDIFVHMPRLNKFNFSIYTMLMNDDIRIDLPSNEDIQRIFIENGNRHVGSFVDTLPQNGGGYCHIFSLPYQFNIFLNLNNSFQGGIFNKVRSLTMSDTDPFEHEFFEKVYQAFPFLRDLSLQNSKPQKNKQHSSTFITFAHLNELDIRDAHVDYAEQFLFDKNTRLPNLLSLNIEYKTLVIITNNFTNDSARLNCSRIKHLFKNELFARPKNFHEYFRLL
ncbi:unnamed protein product [Rotaria sp. Silwood2]|nr:unnamed protein product [Rotaria sp. Silwood2]CAF4492888.1 unnamed protein product [Rotaria sp. Silwood2]